MSQNSVQSVVFIVRVPGLVVAVGPFTLHQERPRHVSLLSFSQSGLLRSEIPNFTPLHAALSLSLDRLEHYWLTGETALGFLAGYYACADWPYRLPGVAWQVAKSRATAPPKGPGR